MITLALVTQALPLLAALGDAPAATTQTGQATPTADEAPESAAEAATESEPDGFDEAEQLEPKKKKKGKKHKDKKKKLEDSSPDLAAPGDPFGSDANDLSYGPIHLRSMLQLRYRSTFAEASTSSRADYRVKEDTLVQEGDGFRLNRFFFRVSATPSKYISLKSVLDFSELIEDNVDSVVKQAYVAVQPLPRRLAVLAGVMKLPFSTMELDSSSKYEFLDLGPTDDLLDDLGFAGRDIGVQLLASPLPGPDWLHVTLGAYRGHAYDEHDSPIGSVAGRLETEPAEGLRIGTGLVYQPFDQTYRRPFNTSGKDVLPNPQDPFYPTAKHHASGMAWGADLSYRQKKFFFRSEAIFGDRVDVDQNYGAKSFQAIWGVLGYRFSVASFKLTPAARVEFLDANRHHLGGRIAQYSGSLTLSITKAAYLMFDVTRTQVEAGSPLLDQPKPIQSQPFMDLSRTRVGVQLQAQL